MDKRSLIQVKEYGDVYVDKKDHKAYRCGRGVNVGQLLEIKFQKTSTGYAYYDSASGFIKRSRCLALALLKRPEGAKVVRHKDGDSSTTISRTFTGQSQSILWSVRRNLQESTRTTACSSPSLMRSLVFVANTGATASV